MEKFSLTYYTTVGNYEFHTPKLLAFLRAFGEDFPQFAIQAIYLLYVQGNTSYIVFVSIFFSLVSAIMSCIAFFTTRASILSNKDMRQLKESCIIKNYSILNEDTSKVYRDLHEVEREFDQRL